MVVNYKQIRYLSLDWQNAPYGIMVQPPNYAKLNDKTADPVLKTRLEAAVTQQQPGHWAGKDAGRERSPTFLPSELEA